MCSLQQTKDAIIAVYFEHLEEVLRGYDKQSVLHRFNERCSLIKSSSHSAEIDLHIEQLSKALINSEKEPEPDQPVKLSLSLKTKLYALLGVVIFIGSLYISFHSV